MWGGHRIIFIFTHASSEFSLYYDIELFEDVGGQAGGGVYPTTTIVTKNRIFIPIPNNLMQYFEIAKGKNERKFYVRFDSI
jgi:molecular chaperone HtpG